VSGAATAPRPASPGWYNAVWRWHFYAGLFCIPFVLWLACTGSLYLWRPQIEAWLDRPYAHLAGTTPAASPDAQVRAALRAVPGAPLRKYVLPAAPDAGVDVLVGDKRVTLHPASLAVLRVDTEERRPMRLVAHLHGELLAGPAGSYLVETAACWAIVMLLTGLYLWWPRAARGLGGLLYPRLRGGSRLFWRDIHAVAGIWVSVAALGLILTGLPWASAWGRYLGEVRTIAGATNPPDWTIGGQAPHAEHRGMAMPAPALRPGDLSRVVATARTLPIAPPVLIAPPAMPGETWKVSSDAADRPLRSEARIDGATGRLLSTSGFADRHWIDRAVGYGVAVHEGAFFGLANQLLGTLTALLLMVLAVSGAVLWWRRRPIGLLGAPIPLSRPRFGAVLVGAVLLLGLLLPLFGASLVTMLLVERTLLRTLPGPRRWLGLRAA
jgi:uncharacterized iron-regulated membrane protein